MTDLSTPLRSLSLLFGITLLGLFLFGLSSGAIVSPAFAQEEESNFNNPAQAAKAEALAEAVAEANSEAIAEAEADLADAIEEGDPDAITDAETALADAISDATSVSEQDIADMRAEGMGWGEIAHELGVHPSTLGLGHAKQAARQAAGLSLASLGENPTGRNFNNGKAKTPGVTGSGNGKALGLSKTSVKATKAKNANAQANSGGSSSGGKGKGKNGSNAGGNGKGKGNS